MKRFLCFILIICLLLPSVGGLSAFADFDNDKQALTDFATDFYNLLSANKLSLSGEVGKYYSDNEASVKAEASGCTNRLIVKSEKEIDSLNAIGHICGYNDLHVLQFKNSADFTDAVEYYATLDCVEYFQEDSLCEESAVTESVVLTQNESNRFGFTAYLQNLSDNNVSYDNNVVVAVVDTGIANDHTFLYGRILPTGFNSINPESDCYDDRGHGTHVAGIIVQNTPENVLLKPYKVLNSSGQGTELQVYLGIQAAVEDNVDVINLSLSIKGESNVLKEAVDNAYNSDIPVIVSSGNKGVDLGLVKYSPACFENVITVGSCGLDFYPSDFSNYGEPCDIFAPGEDVYSTHLNNSYKSMSGTSMAAPFISSAVCYLLLIDSSFTPDEIKSYLLRSTGVCKGRKGGRYIVADSITTSVATTATPVLSMKYSYFSEPFELSITCATEDAQIYYRTSEFPDGYYELYSEPIPISHYSEISVYAQKAGLNDSAKVNKVYIRNEQESSLFTVDNDGFITSYSGTDKEIVLPVYVNKVAVKGIAKNAFLNNTEIESVYFQGGETTISEGAFSGCSNLKMVYAKFVTDIEANALYNCQNLRLFYNDNVTHVGDNAFYNCVNLNGFNFSNVIDIGDSAFENVSAIKGFGANIISSIGKRAFYNSGVTDVDLPNAVEIGESAFANCFELQAVNIPRVQTIYGYVFENCSKITDFRADEATSIGVGVLENCDNMQELSVNSLESFFVNSEAIFDFDSWSELEVVSANSVTEIPDNLFYENVHINNISFHSVESIGENAFNSILETELYFPSASTIKKNAFVNCSEVTSFSADWLTEFNADIFSSSNKITELSLNHSRTFLDGAKTLIFSEKFPLLRKISADSMITIPEKCFKDCSLLSEISFAEVEYIGDYAFYNTAVSDIKKLPYTNVGKYSFAECANINIISNNFVTIDDYAFANCGAIETVFINCQQFGENIFRGSNSIKTIELNNTESLVTMNGNVLSFEYLPKLTTVKIPSVSTIPAYAFTNYPALETIQGSRVSKVGTGAFKNLKTLKSVSLNPTLIADEEAFYECSNLENFNGGSSGLYVRKNALYNCKKVTFSSTYFVISIGEYGLYGCENIKTFNFSKLTDIDNNGLNGTQIGGTAQFPALTKVGKDAFDGTSFDKITIPTPSIIQDLPDNCHIAIGSKTCEITAPAPKNSTIYAKANTSAYNYAKNNKVKILEFNETNPIINDVEPVYWNYNSNSTFDIIGFQPTFDWYGSNDLDELLSFNGSVVSRTAYSYKISNCFSNPKNIYKYYLCDVYNYENGNKTFLTSQVITNAFYGLESGEKGEFSYNDFSVRITERKQIEIDGFINNNSLFELNGVTHSESGSNKYFGTGSKLELMYEGQKGGEITVILEFDANGDGIVDVLDAAITERFSNNGSSGASSCYEKAVDLNGDGYVRSDDYQQIVNEALAS